MRLLLVNPWIADVAAHNFWLRPLGLYRLAEWAWERGAEPALVDCLSPAPAPGKLPRFTVEQPPALRRFRRRFARYGIAPEELRARIRAALPFDAALVTSTLSYWYPGTQWTVAELRRSAPTVPVYLGGIYPTLWPEHARDCSGADRIFPGALETASEALAQTLGLPHNPIREFRPWYELGLHDGADYSAVRTARGCPFRCSYCASDRVSGPYTPRSADSVLSELRSLVRFGVRQIAFYDDALLVVFGERLRVALEQVVHDRMPLEFHTPNGLHARMVDDEVAHWLAKANFATVRLSLETVDEDRQRETGGKVATEDVVRAIRSLTRAGIAREAIGVYLLLGLPGQDLAEVRDGVERIRSLGVRPHLAEFSPVPGTPEWDRLTASGAIPADLDPLLTNNSVFFRLFGDYPAEEREALLRRAREPLAA